MKIQNVIEKFTEFKPLVVDGTTFTPESLEEVKLETGDSVFWVEDDGNLWLALDAESDEVILFNKIEEEVDSSGETMYFNGTDYELEYEATGFIIEDGEQTEKLLFKDYEANGEVLRVVENTVTANVEASLGKKITDEDFQED